jgi:hypothetical protein
MWRGSCIWVVWALPADGHHSQVGIQPVLLKGTQCPEFPETLSMGLQRYHSRILVR